MKPLISIIIPTYNRAHVLQRAIDSVIKQSFKNIEIIVVDDGSTDDTKECLTRFTDTKISYYHQTNGGVCRARNYGVSKAKGEYLVFLDSDDELKPDYLKDVNNALVEDADIVFVGVDLFRGGKLLKVIKSSAPYGKHSQQGLYLAGSFVVKRAIFLEAGGYDELLTYGENTELAIRLSSLLKKKRFIVVSLLNVFQEQEGRTSNSYTNIINSNEYLLKKHVHYYTANPHPKWLYHNILALAYAKTNRLELAQGHLVQAMKTYPWRMKAYLRYLVISIPFLKKLAYRV